MKRRSNTTKKKDGGPSLWRTIRKKCPECIIEDCPSMMGYDTNDQHSSIIDGSSMDSESSVISHK